MLTPSQTAPRKNQEYEEALKAYEREQSIHEGGVASHGRETGFRAQWINTGKPDEGNAEDSLLCWSRSIGWLSSESVTQTKASSTRPP